MNKSFMSKILGGLSLGIVVALIPGALLGEIMKLFKDVFPLANDILRITSISTSLMPAIIGVCIALQFGLEPIQMCSVTMAAVIGSGVVRIVPLENGASALALRGTGDVINIALTVIVAVLIVNFIGDKIKAYNILVIPALIVVVAGGFGMISLPYVKMLTGFVGKLILAMNTAEPLIMGILISASFALLIMSPFSTVAVALAISLAGIGSGAANLGITATSFALAILGFKVNSLGISLAHILGSPKMQMGNFIKKPLMAAPVVATAAVTGLIGAILGIKGTPMSAGFGISGLVGPINAYNLGSNVISIFIVFIIVPIVAAFIFNLVFKKIVKIISDDDYKINF